MVKAVMYTVVLLLCALLFVSSMSEAASAIAPAAAKEQIAVARASELVIWSMPLVSLYNIEQSVREDLGGDVNQVVYLTDGLTSKQHFLTGNSVSKYVLINLQFKDGRPIILSIPASTEKLAFSGSIVNAFQHALVDIGKTGKDQGLGANFLLIPPNSSYDADTVTMEFCDESIPGTECATTIRVDVDTIGASVALRTLVNEENGRALATPEEMETYIKKIRISHHHSVDENNSSNETMEEEEEAEEETVVLAVDPNTEMNTLVEYDISYFADLHAVLARERNNILPRDRVFVTWADALFDIYSDEFNPSKAQTRIMEKALVKATTYMQYLFTEKSLTPFYSDENDNQWMTAASFAHENETLDTSFETSSRYYTDARASLFYWATFVPANYFDEDAPKFSFYLMLLNDSNGSPLTSSHTYKLKIPQHVPAEEWWSVTAYDLTTKSFIQDSEVVGISSRDQDLHVKRDGSIEIVFTSASDTNNNKNIIPTSGCDSFFLIFRFYGPTEALFDREWVLSNVMLVSDE